MKKICYYFTLVLLCIYSLNAFKISLRFPRVKHVRDDDWVEFQSLQPKLKRWSKENNTIEHDPVNMEEHIIQLKEAPNDFTITDAGFELVDLHPRILPYLLKIKKEGLTGARVGPTTAGNKFLFFGGGNYDTVEDQLARALQGSDSFSLGGDTYHYAFRCAGFVIRKGGPEGSKLNGTGFDMVAQRVHIDQDINGEPLLSMGLSWIFNLPFMRLLNVWSPFQDVRLRPLAFADRRTLNVETDVVRYRTNSTANAGGRLGSFSSDRLMSLFSENHQWYWYPNVRFGQALAFDTSNVPHSSFTLPGEEILGDIRNDLATIRNSPENKAKICSNVNVYPEINKDVSLDMQSYIGAAHAYKRQACAGKLSNSDFEEVLEFITRASLEIRCVTLVVDKSVATVSMFLSISVLCLFLYKILN